MSIRSVRAVLAASSKVKAGLLLRLAAMPPPQARLPPGALIVVRSTVRGAGAAALVLALVQLQLLPATTITPSTFWSAAEAPGLWARAVPVPAKAAATTSVAVPAMRAMCAMRVLRVLPVLCSMCFMIRSSMPRTGGGGRGAGPLRGCGVRAGRVPQRP